MPTRDQIQKLDSLERWTPYRKGLCDGCWATCCTLPVEVNVLDLIRLGVATEDEAARSQKALARRLEKEKIIQSFSAKRGVYVLAQKALGDCLYLDSKSRLCTVYEKRPDVCRLFPKIGPKPGSCPYLKK